MTLLKEFMREDKGNQQSLVRSGYSPHTPGECRAARQ